MKEANNIVAPKIQPATCIALVMETRQGEATKLTGLHDREIPLRGHLSDVPWLEVGDEVVIVETADGAIVSGRLRRAGELPVASFSVDAETIKLMGDRLLCIQIGESRFELLPNGRVRLEGKEVTQLATGSMSLLSPVIEVN